VVPFAHKETTSCVHVCPHRQCVKRWAAVWKVQSEDTSERERMHPPVCLVYEERTVLVTFLKHERSDVVY